MASLATVEQRLQRVLDACRSWEPPADASVVAAECGPVTVVAAVRVTGHDEVKELYFTIAQGRPTIHRKLHDAYLGLADRRGKANRKILYETMGGVMMRMLAGDDVRTVIEPASAPSPERTLAAFSLGLSHYAERWSPDEKRRAADMLQRAAEGLRSLANEALPLGD